MKSAFHFPNPSNTSVADGWQQMGVRYLSTSSKPSKTNKQTNKHKTKIFSFKLIKVSFLNFNHKKIKLKIFVQINLRILS